MNAEEYEELQALTSLASIEETAKGPTRFDRVGAMQNRQIELWEKYAPIAWQGPYDPSPEGFNVWVLRPDANDPQPPMLKPHTRVMVPPHGTKPHELRWLLRNVACVETMLTLAREGYRRYRAALAPDAMERIDEAWGAKADPKHPQLIVRLKFDREWTPLTAQRIFHWGMDFGEQFFREPLYGWAHAAARRAMYERNEISFKLRDLQRHLEENEILDPMEPLEDMEERCGVAIEATMRAARRTGRGWTQTVSAHIPGAQSYIPPASVVIRIPYDHPGHGA